MLLLLTGWFGDSLPLACATRKLCAGGPHRHAHRDHLHRRRSPDRQDRQHQFQLHGAEAGGCRACRCIGAPRSATTATACCSAFRLAGERADAVIVNGGLGPTVDDLSQEIAAQAAGVGLVLHEEWLARMEAFFLTPRAQHAAEQPQAGDAAGRRGDARQSDRHRLRLRDGHRQRAVLLHARRAARAAAHAGGADHSAAAGAQRRADRRST